MDLNKDVKSIYFRETPEIVFRNPEDDFAGRLIEECGLKGKTIGGAQVSEKHAGFIINKNNATTKDILEMIVTLNDYTSENFKYKVSSNNGGENFL